MFAYNDDQLSQIRALVTNGNFPAAYRLAASFASGGEGVSQGDEISYTFIEDGFPAARSDGLVPAEASGAWPLGGIEVQDALAKSSWLAASQDWQVA